MKAGDKIEYKILSNVKKEDLERKKDFYGSRL